MTEKTVLSIDPGTHKCGMALVSRSKGNKLELLWRAIVPTESVVVKLHEAYSVKDFQLVILGNSTGSKQVKASIREELPSLGLLLIDESDTTMQARERYWEYHPRRGWRKILPATLQNPPVPIDDFAALVLAERVLLDS